MSGISSFCTHTHSNRYVISGQFLFHEQDFQSQLFDSVLNKAKHISKGQVMEVIMLLNHCNSNSRHRLVTFFNELATMPCSKNGSTSIIWGFDDEDLLKFGQLLMDTSGLQFQFLNLTRGRWLTDKLRSLLMRNAME